MGQYHNVVNLDKRAGYSPRSLASFVKLMEQGLTPAPCAALTLLLSDPNGWGGERIAVIGDYARNSDLPTADPYPAAELWDRVHCSRGMKNVGWLARKVVTEAGIAEFERKTMTLRHGDGTTTRHHHYDALYFEPAEQPTTPHVVAYNHDKNETITPTLLGDPGTLLGTAANGWWGGTGTALYVLLAASNKGGARGGGDFCSEDPMVGSWAADHISVLPASEVPEDATDITTDFRSRLSAVEHVRYDVHDDGTVERSWPSEEEALATA